MITYLDMCLADYRAFEMEQKQFGDGIKWSAITWDDIEKMAYGGEPFPLPNEMEE